ncbi:MAG: efflux RND transporter periplasmic adaptor subunit, partial [Aureliella sp.]
MKWRTLATFVVGAAIVFAVGTYWGPSIVRGVSQAWRSVTGSKSVADGDATSASSTQYWTCGMHPWVILPEPGLCPICHMDLTPLDPAKLTGEITIDPVIVQNIGVRVAPVITGPLTKEIRTVGTVTYDETATKDVNTKISGWIEKLNVDETGAVVNQGDPLFELYSPELYQAQEEYLLALNGKSRLTRDLLDDARTKLQFFDIGDRQIKELEERGTVKKTLTVNSPYTGIVVDKNAQEGMKIGPGMRVYQIADLSNVWVMATLYEYQLPYVEVGQAVVMNLEYLPNKTFEGKVAYIYPYLEEKSREVKVRLEFENPDGLLKPGMFATLRLKNTLDRQAVLAPREAIIATGTRKVAFVSLGRGKFEPRNVETGVETEQGLVEVRSGLMPDEEVVVSGQFLLDSESKMRSALAKMVRGDMASEQTSVRTDNNPQAGLIRLPPAALAPLSK